LPTGVICRHRGDVSEYFGGRFRSAKAVNVHGI
jgi:hypothetical protein